MSENKANSKVVLPLPQRMAVAALGGMGAATVCHPMDVVRVQLQIYQYKGSLDAVTSIFRSGGVSSFYNGITAAYFRQWTYGACRIGIFAYLLDAHKTKHSEDPTFVTKLGMGAVSGSIGSFVGNPAELALVRMSADGRAPPALKKNYRHVFDCLQRTVQESGITALWRGAVPTIIRATLLSATTQAVYSETKGIIAKAFPTYLHEKSPLNMFVGTTIGSFVASLVVTPFDVVKSRIQNMPQPKPGEAPLYTGMTDCFVQGLKQEGPFFLYRGFMPGFIKLSPYTTLSLIIVDQLSIMITGRTAY